MSNEALREAFNSRMETHGEISRGDSFFAGDGFLYTLLNWRPLDGNFTLLNFENTGTGERIPIVDIPIEEEE